MNWILLRRMGTEAEIENVGLGAPLRLDLYTGLLPLQKQAKAPGSQFELYGTRD